MAFLIPGLRERGVSAAAAAVVGLMVVAVPATVIPFRPAHTQTAPSGTPTPSGTAAPTGTSRDRGQQFDIQADDGIEWDKDRQTYTARGNVRIVRGDRIVRAPLAIAHYRDKEGGKTEIYWVEVEGGVQVGIGDDTATGERGTYDLDKKIFMLTGRNLSYSAQDARITARDSLEYYENQKYAIARGNAHVVREAEWLKADVITAFFEERREPRKPSATPRVTDPPASAAPAMGPRTSAGGTPPATSGAAPAPGAAPADDTTTRNKVIRVEGTGNAIVNSCDGVGRGNKFIYYPDTGMATLEGNARLTRGEMQMNGERAEMNTRTQFMRLLPGSDGKQVAGTFFSASETFKPDNIPFDGEGVDPCKDRTKQTPGQPAAAPAAPKPAPAGRTR